MPTDDIQDRREQARLAMEGPKQRERREVEQKTLGEKRRTASLAMEGREQRKRRETREKEQAEREEMMQQIDEEVRRKREEELAAKLKQEKGANEALEVETKERQFKETKYQTAQNVIETLKKEIKSSIPTIRTLKTDIARAVKDEGLSSARIAIKEQGKNPAYNLYALDKDNGKGKWLAVSSLMILLLAALGFGGFYWLRSGEDNPVRPVVINSIIPANDAKEIDVSNYTSDMVTIKLGDILATPGKNGTLTYVYLTKSLTASSTSTRSVTKKIIGVTDFLANVNSPVPPELARFMYNYMLGTYHTASSTWPFLVFKINSYDNVAQEFLSQENGYVRNILASLSGETLDNAKAAPSFVAKDIKSKNTRVLTDVNGDTIFLYSFIDTTTLIMTPNEETFIKVYTAYNSPRLSI
ncbi:MAG: MAP7 domain-containing protein [Patescibacteria group bacterium]|mgnify:CR=1 FL=1